MMKTVTTIHNGGVMLGRPRHFELVIHEVLTCREL